MNAAMVFVVQLACAARANAQGIVIDTLVFAEQVVQTNRFDSRQKTADCRYRGVPAAIAGAPPVFVRTRTPEW